MTCDCETIYIDMVIKDGIVLVQSGVLIPTRHIPEPLAAPVPMT